MRYERVVNCEAAEVCDDVVGYRCVDVFRMWQMMCTDEDIARTESHVPADLAFDRQICLVCVSILKILRHTQHEGQQWSKADECLIIEAHSPGEILSARRHTGSCQARRTERRSSRS